MRWPYMPEMSPHVNVRVGTLAGGSPSDKARSLS